MGEIREAAHHRRNVGGSVPIQLSGSGIGPRDTIGRFAYQGFGFQECPSTHRRTPMATEQLCPTCNGSGHDLSYGPPHRAEGLNPPNRGSACTYCKCEACDGTGITTKDTGWSFDEMDASHKLAYKMGREDAARRVANLDWSDMKTAYSHSPDIAMFMDRSGLTEMMQIALGVTTKYAATLGITTKDDE